MNPNLGTIINNATQAGYKVGWIAGVLTTIQNLKNQKLIRDDYKAEQIIIALLSELPPDLLNKN